ncbi:MAG: GGDEF domain-containing protein [Paracoccus denitrificans]|nr:MAG: GGDEF domain-containing protein [Paracoccus denitrificans]PZO84163.1 MAG: GGDEF domain-containing protein [Paracoccus denitrificans]
MNAIMVPVETLGVLMPMHLLVDANGGIKSVGPTLHKMIGDVDHFTEILVPARLDSRQDDARVFLRLIRQPETVLRGVRTTLGDGDALYDLGFGIGLPDAVGAFNLTESDFSPSGLAMELLFLHEANAAMTAELSRSNLRLEEARAQAESQAFTDPLTGLYNRRGLEIATDLAMRNVGEGADKAQGFALLHIDLDHFKELNDQHGHAMGDEMLVEVARKLREATRSDDTIARMGGDEFVVLLPGLTDAERLRRLGLRIIESIEAPVSLADVWCRVSASIGATMANDYDLPDPVTMMADADRALYAAKKAGRGCIRLAHEPAPDPSQLSDQPFVPHQV